MTSVLIAMAMGASDAGIHAVYSTADLAHGLREAPLARSVATRFTRPDVTIDFSDRRQEILGFGGTFTENTAYNLKRLPPAVRNRAIRLFFDPKEANWTLLRVSINSADASSRHYTYAEVPSDTELEHFSIQTDVDNFMIPGLRMALRRQPKLRIQASPWTAPRWMKDTKLHNRGKLLPEYYSVWARYFSRYLSEYKRLGVPIWSVTPQNEPDAFAQAWDAMGWTDEELGTFVERYLAPTLRRDHPEVKIYGWDHNKNNMERWARANLDNPARRPNYDGVAYHWYEGGEGKMFEPVARMHAKYPELPLIANEQGLFGTFLMQPQAAELYGVDLLQNLNHGCAGWIVWGTLFDHMGGPNHASNWSHSPIMAMMSENRLIMNPSYYYIAQVSRYVQPGAVRVGHTDRSGLVTTAFENPDKSRVLVVLNTTADGRDLRVDAGDRFFFASSPGRSMATFVWRR